MNKLNFDTLKRLDLTSFSQLLPEEGKEITNV